MQPTSTTKARKISGSEVASRGLQRPRVTLGNGSSSRLGTDVVPRVAAAHATWADLGSPLGGFCLTLCLCYPLPTLCRLLRQQQGAVVSVSQQGLCFLDLEGAVGGQQDSGVALGRSATGVLRVVLCGLGHAGHALIGRGQKVVVKILVAGELPKGLESGEPHGGVGVGEHQRQERGLPIPGCFARGGRAQTGGRHGALHGVALQHH